MAKGTTGKAGGTSRVRFVFMEAEIADGGDLAQITQAMQIALRGSNPTAVKRMQAQSPQLHNSADAVEGDVVEDEVPDDAEGVEPSSNSQKVKAPRKPAPKPAVIQFDISSAPALSSLSDPKSNHKRYLKIAAWLHDHRNIEVVTADHIYTCYRHLGWPIDILDFSQPLRELKHKQYFTTPERGKYAINQLGLAKAAEATSD
jgi:hypothetical protein